MTKPSDPFDRAVRGRRAIASIALSPLTDSEEPSIFPMVERGAHRVGGVIDGRYRLERVAARSLMSTVYEGRHLASGARVAVKVLEPPGPRHAPSDRQARFHREAVMLGRLSSPRIVRVHDYGQDANNTFLVMEWLAGRTLRDLLDEEGPLPVSQAVDLVVQIAEGLDEAHRQGIVHRDIKPGNVMVRDDGAARIVKLIDFGIGKDLDAASAMTLYNGLVGSPRYMAPEQILGTTVSPRTDQYGLGLLLYTLLTGEHPFGGRPFTSLLFAHLHESPPDLGRRLEAGSTAIARVVARCVAKRPEDRFPNMGAVARALTAARFTSEPTVCRPLVPATPAPPREDPRPWWLLAIGFGSAVVGALVAAGAMLLWVLVR